MIEEVTGKYITEALDMDGNTVIRLFDSDKAYIIKPLVEKNYRVVRGNDKILFVTNDDKYSELDEIIKDNLSYFEARKVLEQQWITDHKIPDYMKIVRGENEKYEIIFSESKLKPGMAVGLTDNDFIHIHALLKEVYANILYYVNIDPVSNEIEEGTLFIDDMATGTQDGWSIKFL